MIVTLASYILPLVLIGLGLLVAMVKWPKVWIASLLLYLPFFLTDTGKGLNARELAMGAFYSGTILIWMVWSIGRTDRRLVRSWLDFLVLLYVVLMLGNIIIATINEIPLLHWVSDYAVTVLILYYFPIREYFTEERDLKQLLVLAGISAIFMAAYTLNHYRQRMLSTGLVYAFQLLASRSVTLAPIHLLAILFSTVGMFFAKRFTQVLLGLVIVANAIALFISFGRTLWVLFFVCLGIAMFFLTFRQNVKIVATIVVSATLVVTGAYAWNPRLADIATSLVKRRFASSTQLSGGDYSFETRLIEAERALRLVKDQPLGGNGLRATFMTYDPTVQENDVSAFVHIGYIGLAMRLGIPMLLLMLAILLTSTVMAANAAFRLRWQGPDNVYRVMAVTILANTPVVYVNIFMSGIFDQRYGNITFAFIFACTAIVHDYVMRRPRNTLPLPIPVQQP